MVVVADAAVAIRGDMSGFHSDLKGAETATTTLGGKLREIFSVRNLALGAGIFGVGVGLRNIVGYAGDVAAAYSDLEQSTKTVDDLFGTSAGVIEDWGERAADAAGLTKNEVNESASVIGQTLLNVGYDALDAADMVVTLQQRAADLAVAFNQPTAKAILGIGALLRGEYDTIEKFGVRIKQADVDARILAMGLDTSTEAAERQAEAVAALDVFLDQTSGSSGRFAASQDDVAVKLQQAQAKIDNFTANTLGPAVVGIQLGAIGVAEAVGGYFETAGNNIDTFALNFGDQRVQIAQTAEDLSMDFVTLKDRVVALMQDGMSFDMALEVAADPQAAHEAGLILMGGVGDAIAEGAAEYVEPAVTEMMRGAGDMIAASAPDIQDAADIIAKIPESAIAMRYDAIRGVGHQTVLEYAKGLLTPQNDVEIAIEAALQVVEDEMSITEELAFLSGQKTVLENARGIASQEGNQASLIAIDAALAVVEDRMRLLADRAYDWGFHTASEYARGMTVGKGLVVDPARQLATRVGNIIGIESEPKDHTSPLYGITKWGGNIVKTIAGGIYGELGTGSNAAAALAGALVPSVGGFAMAGVPLPMGTGGNTYVMNVNGVQREYDNAQAALEALIEMGAFTEGRLS